MVLRRWQWWCQSHCCQSHCRCECDDQRVGCVDLLPPPPQLPPGGSLSTIPLPAGSFPVGRERPDRHHHLLSLMWKGRLHLLHLFFVEVSCEKFSRVPQIRTSHGPRSERERVTSWETPSQTCHGTAWQFTGLDKPDSVVNLICLSCDSVLSDIWKLSWGSFGACWTSVTWKLQPGSLWKSAGFNPAPNLRNSWNTNRQKIQHIWAKHDNAGEKKTPGLKITSKASILLKMWILPFLAAGDRRFGQANTNTKFQKNTINANTITNQVKAGSFLS